jgi:hypothetical protein
MTTWVTDIRMFETMIEICEIHSVGLEDILTFLKEVFVI